MAKPIIERKRTTIDGKKLRQLKVEFHKPKKTILVIDEKYNLTNDIHENTFINLCYEVCSTLQCSHTFFYAETNGLQSHGILELIDNIKPDGIMFVNTHAFRKTGLLALKYFQYVRKFNNIPTILSTEFDKWAGSEGFEKGESGKNLIGFNLKDLLAVTIGKNPFTEVTKEDLTYPVRIIKTREKFDKFLSIMEKKKVVCIDTEGSSLNKIVNTVFTIQFGFKTKSGIHTYVLPWKQKDFTWSDKDLEYIRKKLHDYFLRTDAELVFHYAPYDVGQLLVILKMKFFPADVWDTIGSTFALDENHKFLKNIIQVPGKKQYAIYSLGFLENRFGIFRPKGLLDKDDRVNMARFSLEDVSKYGAFDVVSPLLLRDMQLEMCTDKYIGYESKKAYRDLVVHQLGVMVKMFAMLHNTGIYIDQENALSLTKPDSVFAETIESIRKEIISTKAGKKTNDILLRKLGLNPNGGGFSSQKAEVLSLTKPDHLRTLFFKVLKLEPVRLGKSGEPSTDKAFQKTYKHIKEVKLFGHFNKIKTLKSNFADSIVKLAKSDPDFINDGRLRPSFGFTSVLPGRLSVIKPNSQNIPTRTDKDFDLHKPLVKGIKKNFSVKPGRVMVGSDMSAHEVRVAGIISKDKEIRRVFLTANNAIRKFRLAAIKNLEAAKEMLQKEGDIHIQNVRFFFKKEVTKEHTLRNSIKTVVFGVMYGKMAKALAKEIGISVKEAQNLIDVLFEKWFGLKNWIDKCHEDGKNTFMIKYPNNRIRHLWGYLHEDIWVHHAMDRRAVNSPLQGFASDIGVVAMYCYKEWVQKHITNNGYELDSDHINVVHDAQYSDNLYEHMPMVIYLVEHSMSTMPMNYYKDKFDFDMGIPLSYGMEFGPNWSALNEWNFRNETLLEMLEAEGKRMGKSNKEIKKVLEDTTYMLKIRTKELESNPYKMLINKKTIHKVFDKMNMFKDQVPF